MFVAQFLKLSVFFNIYVFGLNEGFPRIVWCTGDVAFRVVDAIRKAEQRVRGSTLADADEEDRTRVYVCDINPNMLEVGKKRAKERGDLYSIARDL